MTKAERPASPATVGDAELLRSVASHPQNENDNSLIIAAPYTEGSDSDNLNKRRDLDQTGQGNSEQSKSESLPSNNAQQLVDHSYTDYSIVDDNDLRLLDENSTLLPKPASIEEAAAREKLKGMTCTYGPMKKNAGGVIQPFPGKLLEVLDRSDLTDIVDWMPHGRAFIVKQPKFFTSDVLPRFFKQTKFLSFTRQLNLWGFKRITKGVDAGSYYHELFIRGHPYLAMRMRRQKIKGTGMKLTPNPDGEPDFYNKYPPVPPLNSCRNLPPLPPLPAGRGCQDLTHTLRNLDRASWNHLSFEMNRDSLPVLGQLGGIPNTIAAARNRLRDPYAIQTSLLGRHSAPVTGLGYARPGVWTHDNISTLSDALSFEMTPTNYLQSTASAARVLARNPQHDPINELSIIARNRSHSAIGLYPTLHRPSERLLLGQIHDLDLASKLKRQQQDINMLRRAQLLDDFNLYGSRSVVALESSLGAGVGSTYGRYYTDRGLSKRLSQTITQGEHIPSSYQNPLIIDTASVSYALEKARHLEELALAQRVKARSLALSGTPQGYGTSRDEQSRPEVVGEMARRGRSF